MARKKTAPITSAADIARIRSLARSFPSLSGAPGTDPWDPVALDRWAAEQTDDRAEAGRCAAEFVLRVWDCWDLSRHASPFDLVFAWFVWDGAHRAAFRAWADDPFWLGDRDWQEGREPTPV